MSCFTALRSSCSGHENCLVLGSPGALKVAVGINGRAATAKAASNVISFLCMELSSIDGSINQRLSVWKYHKLIYRLI